MILYAAGEQWLEFTDAGVRHVARYPQLAVPATVVWQPAQTTVGVAAFEGDSRHAAVLIERRLRTEGAIEAETKVFLHHVERVGRTYQALYSSASLDEWHRMQGWASAQPHHCAWLLAPALAWSNVAPGKAVVLHTDNAFVFFGRSGSRIVQANTLAFGADDASVAYAARALGERIREALKEGGAAADDAPIAVQWLSAIDRTDIAAYQRTTTEFADASHLQVMSADDPLRLDGESDVRSALPKFAREPALKLLLNKPHERLLLMAERHRMVTAAAAIVLACVFFGVAGQKALMARQLAVGNASQAARIAEMNGIALDPAAAGDESYKEQLIFVDAVGKLQTGLDVDEILMALKSASGADMRILSVRAEEVAADRGPAPRGVIVDGVFQESKTNPDSATLSAFVRSLAMSGYVAEPVETRAAAAASNVSSRLFTYRLIRKEEPSHTGAKT